MKFQGKCKGFVPWGSGGPYSDTGVIGEALRTSEGGGVTDRRKCGGYPCDEAISRNHKRQEMFSSRRPSLREALHFVNTRNALLRDTRGTVEDSSRHTGPHPTEGILTIELHYDVRSHGENW